MEQVIIFLDLFDIHKQRQEIGPFTFGYEMP